MDAFKVLMLINDFTDVKIHIAIAKHESLEHNVKLGGDYLLFYENRLSELNNKILNGIRAISNVDE